MVVLTSPKLDGDKLTFTVEVLEGSLAGDGPAAIFIDIIGRPLTPVSYAGVARRTAYRGAWYGGAAVAGAAVGRSGGWRRGRESAVLLSAGAALRLLPIPALLLESADFSQAQREVHMRRMTGVLAALIVLVWQAAAAAQTDPLPSWNDGAAKQAIVEFVEATTKEGAPDFVPPPERIATFDQDGTLWVEHPMYSQIVYVLDSVPALVKAKPELADQEPFKTVLTGDLEAVAKLPKADLEKLLMATLDRHDRRRFPRQRHEVDGGGEGSSLEAALHRPHLPADAGGAAVPPRQRLQDLHRHRRRPGLRPLIRRRRPTAFPRSR